MQNSCGLICRARVKHVYAAHLIVVDLNLDDGTPTSETLKVRLPIDPPTVLRPCECPPLVPLRLFDPNAPEHLADVSGPLPGPCPDARQSVLRHLSGHDVRLHVPMHREHFLERLQSEATVCGDLWLTPGGEPPERPKGHWLSTWIIDRGIAQPQARVL